MEQILHEETAKKEESQTILRSTYTKHMRLYERYLVSASKQENGVISGHNEGNVV